MCALMRRALFITILLLAAAARLSNLGAGLPYIDYIDEGHFVHQTIHMLRTGGWSPLSYVYPTLPLHVAKLAALATAPLYERVHGRPLEADLSPTPYTYYDEIAPPWTIRIARTLTFAAALGVVILTGLLARRVAGREAGLLAMLLAALAPALVIRSSIAGVDMWVTLFITAAFLLAHRAAARPQPRHDAVLAGVMLGLAFASKYPPVLLAIGVGWQLLAGAGTWRERGGKVALAAVAAAVTAVVVMPGLWTEPMRVFWGMSTPGADNQSLALGSYLRQLFVRAEWDQPLAHPELGAVFVIFCAAGAVVGLRDRAMRRTVAGWLVSGGIFVGFLLFFRFRPFRYLLPLVPFACVLAALPYAALRARVSRKLVVDLAAAGAALLLFAQADIEYALGRLRLVDSRVAAVNWLRENVGPGSAVLFVEELAVLPSERARGGARVASAPWDEVEDALADGGYDYVVAGRLTRPGGAEIDARAQRFVQKAFSLRRCFGQRPTEPDPGFWRGNDQLVLIFQRRAFFQPLEK